MLQGNIQTLIDENPIMKSISHDAVGHAFNKVVSGFQCPTELPELSKALIQMVQEAYEKKSNKLIATVMKGDFWEVNTTTDRNISDTITEAVTKFYNRSGDMFEDQRGVVKLFLESSALRLLLKLLVKESVVADVVLKSQADSGKQS